MDVASDSLATFFMVIVACGILVWGYLRAKPYGQLGVLAWLQSAVLMVPWLIFFALFAAGVYLNLVSILLLLLVSTGIYIGVGRRLRSLGQEKLLQERAAARLKQEAASTDATPAAVKMTPEAEAAISRDDLQLIQGIFGIDTFFATETVPYQEGVLFNGNLRGDSATTYARLSKSLTERMGDRYRLFLVESPEAKPVVVVLPAKDDQQPLPLSQQIVAMILVVATVFTCCEAAGFLLNFDLTSNWSRVPETFAIAGGILVILLMHEVGHWVIARRHQVNWSLPFFIPTWQMGSFGAFNRILSWLPNRSVLFDLGFSGPAVGGGLSLLMVLVGFVLSSPDSALKIPAAYFQGSILVGTLAKVILGAALQDPEVGVHPLVIIGWLGLVINALNLMPAGQLDGGRIVHAIYGRRTASWTTLITIITLGIVSFVNPIALYWAIVVLFLQRQLEKPSYDELTEPDDARAALGLLALFLMLATLIPLSPSLAGRLGIGG
jgi:membrane-associated protease RseP (regulator of RpoE activity)